MAATSAGPCENHLCLAADESAQQHHQADPHPDHPVRILNVKLTAQ